MDICRACSHRRRLAQLEELPAARLSPRPSTGWAKITTPV